MKRDIFFTFEEIVKAYNPIHPYRDKNGMIDAIKETKGIAMLDENGEIDYFNVNGTYIIDNQKLVKKWSQQEVAGWLDIFKKLWVKG